MLKGFVMIVLLGVVSSCVPLWVQEISHGIDRHISEPSYFASLHTGGAANLRHVRRSTDSSTRASATVTWGLCWRQVVQKRRRRRILIWVPSFVVPSENLPVCLQRLSGRRKELEEALSTRGSAIQPFHRDTGTVTVKIVLQEGQ